MTEQAKHKIAKKIIGYKVVNPETQTEQVVDTNDTVDIEKMHENMERPEILRGSTYKIKTPQSPHALYITINDMILNADTDYEEYRPYEVFINSKNIDNFQWVLALTRLISAVWRKGGDACFLVEELKSVFDPKGGYFKKGGVFMPSLVAEIGCVIESHLKKLGLIKTEELPEYVQKIKDSITTEQFKNAAICPKCSIKAFVKSEGCMTCLNCGYSHCG